MSYDIVLGLVAAAHTHYSLEGAVKLGRHAPPVAGRFCNARVTPMRFHARHAVKCRVEAEPRDNPATSSCAVYERTSDEEEKMNLG